MAKNFRHASSYSMARGLTGGYLENKFNYHHPVFAEDVGSSYIVVSNHNTDYDPLLLAAAFPDHMYFVAADNIMQMGFKSKLIMRYFQPILRVKGKKEVRTVSEILRTLRGGDNVCIFAEGNRSFNGLTCDILPSTGKMIKKSGAAMVTYKLSGAYFAHPRWSHSTRKGRIDGSIQGVYTAEQLAEMSVDEINEIINRDLWEDAYATQATANIPFKGKNLASGLERALFYCPKCGRFGTLHSSSDHLTCECGYSVKYTETGYLEDENGKLSTITEWDAVQLEKLRETMKISQPDEAIFTDENAKLTKIERNHDTEKILKGSIAAYVDRLEVCGLPLPYDRFDGISVFKQNILVMNFRDAEGELAYYELRGEEKFCALKYLYAYETALKLNASDQ